MNQSNFPTNPKNSSNFPKSKTSIPSGYIVRQNITQQTSQIIKAPAEKKSILNTNKIVNIGLSCLLGVLAYNVFAPNGNNVADNDNPFLVSSRAKSATVSFENDTLLNAAKIQASMVGVGGTMIVTDGEGNLVAGVGINKLVQPASTAKVPTTLAALMKLGIHKKMPEFGGRELIDVLNDANRSSDNVVFDKIADIIGVDYIQQTIRDLTGNQKLTVANGSGCPVGFKASAHSGCGKENPIKRGTYISVLDIEITVRALDKLLMKNGLKLSDVLGVTGDNNSTVSGRYAGLLPDGKIVAKTGTINNTIALAGYGVTKNEKFYFSTILTGGEKSNRIQNGAKILNSALK
jgi:D-Ala-D-Ala carboxypeptidase 3 (S13) family